MAIPNWNPPQYKLPAGNYVGEAATAPIHSAVGRALSEWEHMESALIKLFQLLCETTSFAACRAYGSMVSASGRAEALKMASAEFFLNRDAADESQVIVLIKAYINASSYRNNIAHGMAVQPHAHGYWLCAPSYASRKRDRADPRSQWGLGSHYFYKVSHIDHCRDRFSAILEEAMRLALSLNDKYEILEPGQFHP
jgi:hypothetical protein